VGTDKSKRMNKDISVRLRSLAEEILASDDSYETLEKIKEKSLLIYEALIIACHQKATQKNRHPDQELKKLRLPSESDNSESLPIFEHSTEKIKDIVAQMEPQTEQIDELLEKLTDGNRAEQEAMSYYKTKVEFEPSPELDGFPLAKTSIDFTNDKNKSFIDQLGQLTLGLKDRADFIKHLFLEDIEGFDRILSQINSLENFRQAQDFLHEQVMPEYNNWQGKESISGRFIKLIEQRFKN